ncbi:hypothetical protein A0H81_12539 [Grifola frondosa]|uniref:Uncharacterized protein n=1 Tax=Grifola frondosa TaxID=5627 RepID=A0A1C7LRV5_GRIFR|nr:hypothetical protein A0H81_12539 [Grifola frondosa]
MRWITHGQGSDATHWLLRHPPPPRTCTRTRGNAFAAPGTQRHSPSPAPRPHERDPACIGKTIFAPTASIEAELGSADGCGVCINIASTGGSEACGSRRDGNAGGLAVLLELVRTRKSAENLQSTAR